MFVFKKFGDELGLFMDGNILELLDMDDVVEVLSKEVFEV